jgi:hypothetical protein
MQNNKNFCVPLKERITLLDYALMLQKFGDFNAPRQFQRPIAWKADDRKKFFNSMLMNRVEGTFVLVDVRRCIARLDNLGQYEGETYSFFKKFSDEGYKYVILDGNNRMCFIKSLFDDEYTIPEGKYEFISDELAGTISSFTVRKGKQKFSDLPERVRSVLKERQASISLYTQISFDGMSDVFQNVNSGVPLNAQELRNAYSTKWADFVREISDEVSSLLGKLFKDHRFRLKGEEWIVDCLDMVLNAVTIDPKTKELDCSGITQTSKNKLYVSNFLTEDDENFYFDKFIEMMDFISRMIDEKIFDEKSLTRASAVQNLYWMLCNGVNTYDQAVSVIELHEKAYKDKDRTYACGDDEKTFKECCNGMSKENFEFRYVILSEILNKVSVAAHTIP